MSNKIVGCWGEIQTKQHAQGLQYIPMKNGYTANYPKPCYSNRTKKKNNNGALISLSVVSMIVGLILGIIL